ncbi:hypothetical protein KACHI17_09430 [Sediminibacterium sp. KACHI17]|jgi:hypothetical protein|uniref:DinB-like domain-containing protein n=1 Tax=Sediminibacterium sp. KACHI17 TaxID=1751071 RepID=A0AAT9GHE0_9BACT
MHISVSDAVNLLSRTPQLLEDLLLDIPDALLHANEGGDSWSPYDVVGHLIHGEKTDWIPRMKICLSDDNHKTFTPFDRFAQFEDSKGKSILELLKTFRSLREENLTILNDFQLSPADFERTAIHPAFGTVTLQQLLATWVVHDQNHIYQITRTISHQYREETGPWKAYLRIIQ